MADFNAFVPGEGFFLHICSGRHALSFLQEFPLQAWPSFPYHQPPLFSRTIPLSTYVRLHNHCLLSAPASRLPLLPAKPLGQLSPLTISTFAPSFLSSTTAMAPLFSQVPVHRALVQGHHDMQSGHQAASHSCLAFQQPWALPPLSPGPRSPAGLPEATLAPLLSLLSPWLSLLSSFGEIFLLTPKCQSAPRVCVSD